MSCLLILPNPHTSQARAGRLREALAGERQARLAKNKQKGEVRLASRGGIMDAGGVGYGSGGRGNEDVAVGMILLSISI